MNIQKIIFIIPFFTFLEGCISPAKPYLNMGILLSEAGFVAHPADTTARYAMMNTLPVGRLTYRPSSIGSVFLYADPIGCGCVYMGSQDAFRTLKQRAIVREEEKAKKRWKKPKTPKKPNFPDMEEMSAENRRDTARWDWSAWSSSADPGATQPHHVSGSYW